MGTTRLTKSFSLDRAVLKEVQRTKGASSTSERVNQLLKAGLEVERKRGLHGESAAFFKGERDGPSEFAFHKASLKTLMRDDD